MLKVKITTACNDPIVRQTPKGIGVLDGVTFSLDDRDKGPFDAWFVLDGIAEVTRARCARNNTFFVTYEPPSIRGYDYDFLNQFGTLLTFRTDLKHRNRIRNHPMLPWWVGTSGGHGSKQATRDYGILKTAEFPIKQNSVSCVCSDKALTPDHRKRLDFVRALKKRLGEQLHVFGSGFQNWPDRRPDDKWETIAPYRYHLALENSSHPDYWTEKVADTFLGGAFLIYWGCPNLADYFPQKSFLRVNRDDPGAAAEAIQKLLDADQYQESRPAIDQARRLVLDKYNLFAELATCAKTLQQGPFEEIRIKSEESFKNTFVKRARRFIKRNFGGTSEKSLALPIL